MGKQGQVSLFIPRLDLADFLECLLKGSAVVKGCPVIEAKSVPRFHRNQFHVIGEPFPEQRKEFLEEERGRDDRRARIVPVAVAFV